MYASQLSEKKTGLFILSGLCLSLVPFLYYPVFKSLVQDWLHLPDFSHGFFVPLVAAYFAWGKREEIRAAEISPGNSGLVILILGLILLILGKAASEYFTMRFSFLVVLAGAIVFLCGCKYLKVLAFPLFFLVFMIPVPSIIIDKITSPLQFFASIFAVSCIDSIGIPVLREGNVIHLANSSLEVAEACSGIRSFVCLIGLGTAFAYFARKTLSARLILILSCIPIAVLVNAFRVTLTGVLASCFGSSVAEGFFHSFSGYFLFAVALLLLLLLNFALSLFVGPHHRGTENTEGA